MLTQPHHLAARFVTSLSAPPAGRREVWAESHLLPGESRAVAQDVEPGPSPLGQGGRRFVEARPQATRAEIAGALLHDVGKIECGLGTWGRVAASVVGARTERFRSYHDHEHDRRPTGGGGRQSDPATVELIDERGPAYATLKACDRA